MSAALLSYSVTCLSQALARLQGQPPVDALRGLVDERLDEIPFPGTGLTFERWRALACVGAHDLALAKLYEGHTDALAILHELDSWPSGGRADGCPEMDQALSGRGLWGVWCAELPDAVVRYRDDLESSHWNGHRAVRLNGKKAWCSGAQGLTHALLSCRAQHEPEEGRSGSCLVAVPLSQPGVEMTREGWHAVGMASSASVNVRFDNARAWLVGEPGEYVERPGFLHGGAGVAACWYGAAARLAQRLLHDVQQRQHSQNATVSGHALAHLGALDVCLHAAASALREAAAAIDVAPQDPCLLQTARARLAVEAAAQETLLRCGRALGAGPLCREPAIARLFADLPVFIRQSHAEKDQAALGSALAEWTVNRATDEENPWQL